MRAVGALACCCFGAPRGPGRVVERVLALRGSAEASFGSGLACSLAAGQDAAEDGRELFEVFAAAWLLDCRPDPAFERCVVLASVGFAGVERGLVCAAVTVAAFVVIVRQHSGLPFEPEPAA